MSVRPASRDAVELFMRGAQAFSCIEANGILIDRKYLIKQLDSTAKEIKKLEGEFKEDEVYKTWRKRFGHKTQLGSKAQLEKVIFDDLKFERTGRVTESGGYKADESAFEFVDHPFVRKYFRCEKLKKARSTYLLGYHKEICADDRIHPIMDLHIPVTYRPSCSRPNVFNVPVRNEEMGSIIRNCVIAPPEYQILEIDLSGAEVCWSVNYHKDPKMKAYIEDPKSDMHRDMAMQVYKLPRADDAYWKGKGKNVRYCAKNKFVFPEFYGSFFLDCSQSLWEAIDLMKLEAPGGVPLKKHLRKNGVRKLGVPKGLTGQSSKGRIETEKGSFLEHVRQVEEDFWGNRFKVYKQWKWDWWQKYCDRGWFRFLTGFVGQGLMDRKQVCNSPVQGAAFHHLLWALVEIQDWMIRKKMKSKIVNTVYDSIVFYAHKKEVQDILIKSHDIITKKAREHWKCIIVPITVEAELAPLGESWYRKKKVEIAA